MTLLDNRNGLQNYMIIKLKKNISEENSVINEVNDDNT